MRKLFMLLPLLLAACSSSQGSHVTCVDDMKACENKAIKLCPKGYTVVNKDDPHGTGMYYANHRGSAAHESMIYGMNIACK